MALRELNNEKALLINISQGDERAFAELFYGYYNQVAEFVQSVAHDEQLTEEIVQDVFAKVWANRNQLASVGKFTAYLFILTRNHTLNTIRKVVAERKAQHEFLQLQGEVAELPEAYKEPQPEYEALLIQAAALLPPQQQQVFALRRKGIKNPEIARQMNLSPDSVKKYYQLAIRFIANFVKTHGLIPLLFFIWVGTICAQNGKLKDAQAALHGDTLILENAILSQRYLWNNGDLMLAEMLDKRTGKRLSIVHPQPDLVLPGGKLGEATLSIAPANIMKGENEYLAVQIANKRGQLEIKREARIYPGTPAIHHQFYFKGLTDRKTVWEHGTMQQVGMIEHELTAGNPDVRMGYIPLEQGHWKFKAVSFRESTDQQDNPVQVRDFLPYRVKEPISANVLIGRNRVADIAIFVIKEAPIAGVQAYYPGYDFQVDQQAVRIHGIGVAPKLLSESWLAGYGYAIGMTGPEDWQASLDMITFQKKLRAFIPGRDNMVLANTWGDRNRDSRMTEQFILEEIKSAAQLGITHLQLDDGWQTGLSQNSAEKAGEKWDHWNPEDWVPNLKRFPHGFEPIVVAARRQHIQLCLWFNPSKADNYSRWKQDADVLIGLYKKYGISVFKIDGSSLENRESELNLRKLFGAVQEATQGKVVFNLDVTAGHRIGYHFFQEYGNIFLENRYTDWGNYYPSRTLRNLWLLSSYVPAERLQIEFLNVFRNADKYPANDPIAPSKAGLNFAAGVSFPAQPLAWMELSQLGDGRDSLAGLLKKRREIIPALNQAALVPIGDEPDGFSWPGFLAMDGKKPRYLMIYRECTDSGKGQYLLPVPAGKVSWLLGDKPTAFSYDQVSRRFFITFQKPFSFAVFVIN
ncbi:RNA polymerase sigma factor, sigma-70 family [bacterium A37T11]|nr:RNA polymerase sigma factor, sigma-70 family [bacterium A37T11]